MKGQVSKTGGVARRLSREIPEAYCGSDDARLQWLWNQRLEVVQNIHLVTRSVRTRMATSLILSATMLADLRAIELLLKRLEGGAKTDEEVQEEESSPI